MPNKNIKGSFKVKDNDLFFLPLKSTTDRLPHTVKITGKWRLDKKFDLIFDVDEAYNDTFGETIGFSTKIEHASSDYLEINLLTRKTPSLHNINSVKFNGRWKVGFCNDFIFEVKRTSGHDELNFGNNWQITKNNQIVLFYKRKFLKKEIINSFILEGSWKLGENALIFNIENNVNAELKFRLALNKKQVIFKKEKIDFTVGVEVNLRKKISLFGRLKQASNSLEFATNFGTKKISWIFRIKKIFTGGKEVALELINTKGEPVGIELTLSKTVFKDANIFIRAKHDTEDKIETGFRMPF